MAKGINLFLVLLGALVFVHQRNEGVSVGALDPSALSVDTAYRYANAAGSMRSSPRDRLQEIYRAEVGVRERTGRNDGSRVAEYLRYTDLGEGYAWCASFVSWVYGEAGWNCNSKLETFLSSYHFFH